MPVQKPGKSVQEVETPADLMAAVEKRFGRMDFDLAANAENAKAEKFFHPGHDSLKQDWSKLNGNLWLNPPYGDIGPWAAKCAELNLGMFGDSRIFMLTPASTGADWFQDHVCGNASILALSPRITFRGHVSPYPKDCCLSVFGAIPSFGIWRWNGKPRRAWNNRIGSRGPCSICGAMDRYPMREDGGGGGCRPCAISRANAWHKAKKESPEAREFQENRNLTTRLNRYGIDRDEFSRLFELQGGLCAICRVNPATHIDHCHKTGKVRGILCHWCNVGIGLLGDSIPILRYAIEYLEKQLTKAGGDNHGDQGE
jgi:phage N-6-adenine-methyltransferase